MANEPQMSGFTISCESCAARLRVTKPSLLGQMLACPKCGTMLRVTAPTAGEPQKDRTAKQTAKSVSQTAGPSPGHLQPELLKTTLTTSDFDEIEQLLIKNPQLTDPSAQADLEKFKFASPADKPNSPVAKAPGARVKQRRSDEGPAQDPAPSSAQQTDSSTRVVNQKHQTGSKPGLAPSGSPRTGPLLPSDQWSSAAVQKRRRMMSLLAAATGLILVLLTVVVYLVNRSKSNPQQVAQQVASPSDDLEATTKNAANLDSADPSELSPANKSADESGPENAAPNAGNSLTPSMEANADANGDRSPDLTESDLTDSTNHGQASLAADSDPAMDEPPPVIAPLDNPPPVLPTDSGALADSDRPGSAVSNSAGDATSSEPPVIDPDAPPALPELNPGVSSSLQPDDLKSPLTSLDRLSQMVDGSQLSVNRFRDLAASAREEQIVGLPKYFIEKNAPAPVDAKAQLAIPISQLTYDSVPLSIVARDMMSITGVPMTIDVESVIARHGQPNPLVKLDVKGVDFGQAIDTMLQSIDLVKLQPETGRGLIFAAAPVEQYAEKKFEIPKLDAASDEERQAWLAELSLIMQGMLAPGSWKLEENPARLSIENSTLSVIHSPMVHFQTQTLLGKVNGLLEANRPADQPDDEPTKQGLQTKSGSMASKLELPSGLTHRFSESLVDLLDTVSRETGVDVLADWEALSPLGWGPLTRMPGTLTGSTLRDTLKELSQSLGITYVIIDEKTILLTSFEAAVERTDLEVYSFRKLLQGKVTAEQALLILNQSFAAELKNPVIRTYYSPRLQGLFVVAPQILQEKIERVIRGLEEL